MRILLALILALWPLAAATQEGAALDPRQLAAQDRRVLQGALVWSGDYLGLTDGLWGPRSEAALAAWLGRQGLDPGRLGAAELRPLLEPFLDELDAQGWGVLNLEGYTVAIPARLLGPPRRAGASIEHQSPDGGLVFRAIFETDAATLAMHDWIAASPAGPEPPYLSWRANHLVSAATLADGRRAYLRSFRLDGIYASFLVLAEDWQRRRADLIAATMQWGWAPDLWPLPGGPLDPAGLAPPAPRPGPPPAAAVGAAPPPAGRPLLGSGTGFFVNATDIVTAAHVVAGCRGLSLVADGTPLRLLATDPTLDLAALAADRRSAAWLPLGPQAGPRLGQPVVALGYPFLGSVITAGQGLSVTSGNVSSLPVADAPGARVSLTAPIQPGNSGGPVLGLDGAVLGVVVSRVDDLFALETEGVLPQNMNHATPVGHLAGFLRAAAVPYDIAAEAAPPDLAQGIPEAVQRAVVAIGCH